MTTVAVIAGQSGTMSSPTSDESYSYQGGLNFFAPFELTQIEPFRAMLGMLPPTGPCPVILRIAWLWNGPSFGWLVDGLAPAKQEIIAGGYVGGTESDCNTGVVTYFNVNAGGTELAVGLEDEVSNLVLWAALDAANGAWKHPACTCSH